MPQVIDDLDMEAYVPFKDKYYDAALAWFTVSLSVLLQAAG